MAEGVRKLHEKADNTMSDNILTELASGDYYEVVRQRLPWIESTIPEARKVVEALRISPHYIETTVRVLEEIWGPKWHPASEPPNTERMVMLRFGDDGQQRECLGYYGNWYGAWGYTYLDGRVSIGTARPTHWRELTKEER